MTRRMLQCYVIDIYFSNSCILQTYLNKNRTFCQNTQSDIYDNSMGLNWVRKHGQRNKRWTSKILLLYFAVRPLFQPFVMFSTHTPSIMRFCVLAAFPHFLLFAWIPADELWIRVNYAPFPSFVIFSTHLHFPRLWLWHSPRASYFTRKDWFCKNTQPAPTHFCKIQRKRKESGVEKNELEL